MTPLPEQKKLEELQIGVSYVTISLYIDSMCEVMKAEPQRITNTGDTLFLDTQNGVEIKINSTEWTIKVPGSKTFLLDSTHIKELRAAISKRENNLLLELHDELYHGGKGSWKIFSKIQKMRKTSSMVEEAWQNLLTVYALNMDGDEDVS